LAAAAGLAGAAAIFLVARSWERRYRQRAADLGGRLRAAQAAASGAGEEARLLEQVLAVVRQGVLLVGEDDLVAYANPAAHDLVRVSDRLVTLVPHGLQRLVRQARIDQAAAEGEMEHGSPPRILRAAAVVFPADKRVLVTISDVTESNRIEAVRRDFVAAASHELKTPVAAVQASAEALGLALQRDPASAQRFAGQVERSAQQLSRLVGDLLDLSRLESSEPSEGRVSLAPVVEAEVNRIGSQAEEAGVTISVRSQPVEVVGSSQDLGLAVRNLLDNAIRHTGRGGAVVVSVRSEQPGAVIEVADTGEGIPRRELPRIFERFYRVDTARSRSTGGTGLGLAIVKHVAERHGGAVTVDTELGVGSTFRITLPIAAGG
jgi:signal transduction histidine kinase